MKVHIRIPGWFIVTLTVILFLLKITVWDISWLWVFAPVWISYGLFFLLAVVAIILVLFS